MFLRCKGTFCVVTAFSLSDPLNVKIFVLIVLESLGVQPAALSIQALWVIISLVVLQAKFHCCVRAFPASYSE